MQLLDLTIGTTHFYLPEDTDLTDLEQRIEGAVRVGGSMIEIPTTHRRRLALITPATSVFLDHIDIADEDTTTGLNSSHGVDLSSPFTDWDLGSS